MPGVLLPFHNLPQSIAGFRSIFHDKITFFSLLFLWKNAVEKCFIRFSFFLLSFIFICLFSGFWVTPVSSFHRSMRLTFLRHYIACQLCWERLIVFALEHWILSPLSGLLALRQFRKHNSRHYMNNVSRPLS
jgi:hypothetical protein